MFALNRTTRVFLKVGATDLRLGFDGLHGQVVTILKQDVLSGHVFGFCNRARTKVKLLMFDGSGLCYVRSVWREDALRGRKVEQQRWTSWRCRRCCRGLSSRHGGTGTGAR